MRVGLKMATFAWASAGFTTTTDLLEYRQTDESHQQLRRRDCSRSWPSENVDTPCRQLFIHADVMQVLENE